MQFRKWATQVVKDYTIQGWVMDVDRLKSGGSVLTQEFFDRQLEKVREIRLSERSVSACCFASSALTLPASCKISRSHKRRKRS